ncbi:MAG: amidophosphoribosyltransferase, partial [Betaproteobacteria bacterium]
TIEDLIEDCRGLSKTIEEFETSCFNGEYVTGDVTERYLSEVDGLRNDEALTRKSVESREVELEDAE